MLKLGSKALDGLQQFAALCLLFLFAAQLVGVILRYSFSSGISWLPDLFVYLFMLSVTAPGPVVVLQNKSVRVDVFYQGMSVSNRRIVDRIGLGLFLAPAMLYTGVLSIPQTLNSVRLLEASPTYGGLPGLYFLKIALTAFFFIVGAIALVLACRRNPFDHLQEGAINVGE